MSPVSRPIPPNPPWAPMSQEGDGGGCLSVYYSDDMSPLAVRWITKPGDNKSDPNLETMTYGLFSTCSKAMRSGIVKRGAEYLFFATRRGGTRVLSGYYHLGWYAPTPQDSSDFCLAAERAHFVEKPIPLDAVDRECGTNVNEWFRSYRVLTLKQALCIAKLLDAMPNAVHRYLEEIDRLERFNLRYGGYRYIAWKQQERFSWNLAAGYLVAKNARTSIAKVRNATPSNSWKCTECDGVVRNRALLKRCPECGSLGSLRGV